MRVLYNVHVFAWSILSLSSEKIIINPTNNIMDFVYIDAIVNVKCLYVLIYVILMYR